MEKFIIQGNQKLRGEISVNGAKNSVLKIIAASILSKEPCEIENTPEIEEVERMINLVKSIGGVVEKIGKRKMKVQVKNIQKNHLDHVLVNKIRSSVLLAGPILVRTGEIVLPHPGGCVIGKRPIDLFIDGFKAFGTEIEETNEHYHLKGGKNLHGAEIVFPKVSVTATEALMTMATLIPGKTILKNAACEPEIPSLAEYLNRCGAKIQGAGTHTIVIQGVKSLRGGKFKVIPDRVETGSFAILGALTNSEITITQCDPSHLDVLWVYFNKIGVRFEIGKNFIKIRPSAQKLRAVDLKTHEYPGFATDIQPPYTVLMTQCYGNSIIHETVFEGRLFYTDILNQMGANIIMCDPYRVIVQGPTKLYGKKVASPDLRAGFALVLAALVAEGKSEIGNIYQIDRGYEKLEKRLKGLGAGIERVSE